MRDVSAQKIQLEAALVDRGWKVVDRGRPADDRWIFETWTIESVWTPLGAQLVLDFETDSMAPTEPGQLLARSPGTPDRRVVATVFLRPKWERDLTMFIKTLDEHRDSLAAKPRGSDSS
jgi:hypothetical protein